MDDSTIFRALVDPTRRLILDRLFERDGQTLTDLAAGFDEMSRQGVMKHLGVLEEAGLIVTRRSGRQKLHYLNPVPIRQIHDRWISRYTEPLAAALGRLTTVLEKPMSDNSTHVYQTFIATTPERLWQAITDPAITPSYYYGTAVHSDWQVGSPLLYDYPDGTIAADGKILEVDPGRRVVMEFNAVWDEAIRPEPPVRMTWEIEANGKTCKLTVTTEGLAPGSETDTQFRGGVLWIVSGLKTFLETGSPLPSEQAA